LNYTYIFANKLTKTYYGKRFFFHNNYDGKNANSNRMDLKGCYR